MIKMLKKSCPHSDAILLFLEKSLKFLIIYRTMFLRGFEVLILVLIWNHSKRQDKCEKT